MRLLSFILLLLITCTAGLSACGKNGSQSRQAQHSETDSSAKTPHLTVRQPVIKRLEYNRYSIEAGADDAQENLADNSLSLDSQDLTLGNHQKSLLGLRFSGIKIPKNSVIESAYIQFSAHQNQPEKASANLQISLEDSANSAPFRATKQNLSARTRLAQTLNWQINTPWQTVNESDKIQRTPELAPLLQQIVNKDSWRSGNAVSFLLSGTGLRQIHSYESSIKELEVSDLAATLVIKLASLQTFKPNAGDDDAEETLSTGEVQTDSSDLELGWQDSKPQSAQLVGIRFRAINITAKAKIHRAYIQFTQDEDKNLNPFAVSIHGELSPNPKPFVQQNKNLSQRKLTQQKVLWQTDKKWHILKESGKPQRTPDLTHIVQALVNQPQWELGNAMTFLIQGKGIRTAEPFESGPDVAPKLVIEYSNAQSPVVIDKIRLTWRDDPSTTMSIIWNKYQGKQDRLYYAEYTSGQCPTNPREYNQMQEPHRVSRDYFMHTVTTRLSNLKPDTAYRFIIQNDKGTSTCSWFRTAPNRPQPFSYLSGGDTKSSGSALQVGRWSNQMVAKVRPLFVLFTGDFNSGIGWNADSWKQWLTDWSTLTRSEDGRMYPLIVVHGNHENGDFEVLYKLFDTGNANLKETAQVTYNAYSFGGDLLHLISLNSELSSMLRSAEDRRQTAWLKRVLAHGNNHALKVVGYHKPMRPHTKSKSEGTHLARVWAPILEQYGVHVAYESDTHTHAFTYPVRLAKQGEAGAENFIRDDKNGIVHVGEGSWGASPRQANDNKPWTLDSGAFNQIKLNRVYPSVGTTAARLEISVIKIAQTNRAGKLVNYAAGVQERDKDKPMSLPKGVRLHITPNYGEHLRIPFHASQ